VDRIAGASVHRLVNLSLKLGATLIRSTVVALRDGSLVNYLYRVDGLASFATEWKRANELVFHGCKVKVIPIERLIRSKEYVGRPKDLAHLPLLRDIMESRKITRIKR
jgi:hypothetical protein